MKFKVDFEMSARVEFKDPEKAKEFFIDGEWKNVFYKFYDLNELAEHLAYGIYQAESSWDAKRVCFAKFVEGFGYFLKVESHGEWIITNPEFGEIVVFTGNLEASFSERCDDNSN